MSQLKKAMSVFIVVSIVFILYSAMDIWNYRTKQERVKTDAAIVLGAAVWDAKPSPVFQERINHAIWLYQNGYVEHLIFTGGKKNTEPLSESEVAKQYALENHVKPEDIFTESQSTITEENLKYAFAIAMEEGFKTFTIVSDPLHMKRSMVMATNLGMKAYSSPTLTSAYKSIRTQTPFFFRELFFYIGYKLSFPFRQIDNEINWEK
ncbi:YdcF family protein [Ammoniphilus sp. YIM 78166]|uniref:YdcF family protein n=1 Tax=Ammoniphilus sp. YIM 78166 TaxID=1644106 RepID=UPI00106FB7A8|nr:YdcF family protein [Ammoniphilus sp. YIM 78166]